MDMEPIEVPDDDNDIVSDDFVATLDGNDGEKKEVEVPQEEQDDSPEVNLPDEENIPDAEDKEEQEQEQDDTAVKIAALEADLKKERAAKNKAFAEKRLSEKQPKGEEKLSRGQLEAIWSEHKDDPSVALNVIDYYMKQATKDGAKEAVDAVKISQIKSVTDKFVSERFPEILDDASEIKTTADSWKSELGLDGNPYADFLVGSVLRSMNFEEKLQQAHQAGMDGKKKTASEDKRKASLKTDKLEPSSSLPSSKKSSQGLSEVEKILGLRSPQQRKLYAEMTRKK